MKLYSDKITEADVRGAFVTARIQNQADIYIDALRTFRPRRHANGVEFWAESLNGTRASGHAAIAPGPRDNYPRAASWTDYGYVIAHLFNIDPEARIGGYNSKADFVAKVHQWIPRGQSLAFLDVLTEEAKS
jgi:hypothetical protein